jgi:dimethylglycine catabolism A
MAAPFTRLLEPGRIGPLALKNRVIMAPMTTRKADAEGFVTDAALAYYRARAEGGVALITVEMASPERAGKHRHFELGIHDDRFLPGLARLVDAIHRAGAKASIQLGHGGGHTRIDIAGEMPIAPSAIPHSVQEGHTEVIVPEEMTTARIAQTRAAFVAAAKRAMRAGFDAVEIHAAHGYLISQFLAPAENRRSDAYGGPLENRARFALEITSAVRAAVPTLAVTFRMNGDDFFQGGLSEEEAIRVADWATKAGADAIHMTGGHYRSQPSAAIMIPPMASGATPFLRFAERVKDKVSVPVIAVGRLGDPRAAVAAIEEERADFIALGRPLLTDPDWVNKVAARQAVRLCLSCNSCVDGMRAGRELRCIVNPMTGRELAYRDRQVKRRGQKIAVIGGGPAGLTYAALVASTNAVTLFERETELGGSFRFAGLAPRFQGVQADPGALLAHVDGLRRECNELGVEIRTGTDPVRNPSLLAGFDHVVIATGARYPRGLGRIIRRALRMQLARNGLLRPLTSSDAARDWFYYRLRRAAGTDVKRTLASSASDEIIGDAGSPGKTEQAILSAYEAAFGSNAGEAIEGDRA